MKQASFAKAIASGEYDFLDFGCSAGGSIERSMRLFGGRRGLGLDLSEEKVAATRHAGYDAVVQDVTDIDGHEDCVRFVTMAHFLEHLPGIAEARSCVESAVLAAREFVFIRQPFFDADGDLFQHGLKLYWSHWIGHSLHMTSLELHDVLRPLLRSGRIHRFAIYAQGPIADSSNDAVHSIDSPIDQHEWDADVHPGKPAVSFRGNTYRQLKAMVTIDPEVSFDALQRRFNWDQVLFDSGN